MDITCRGFLIGAAALPVAVTLYSRDNAPFHIGDIVMYRYGGLAHAAQGDMACGVVKSITNGRVEIYTGAAPND